MKTLLGRIVLIVVMFVLLSGLMVTAVNAGGTTNGTPAFERPDGGSFQPGDDRFSQGERSEHNEDGEAGWILGAIKNVSVIAVITALIVWPKSVKKSKRRTSGIQASETS